jgi:DNA-binding beta-propeller fold protein YncE
LNNLYLLDPSRGQILKYVPVADAWTASVTYFLPGVTPDLSGAVDIAVDTDVWILRKDGTVLRFSSGRPADYALRDLETPIKDPVAISVPVPGSSLFIADAGNQRVLQFEKNTGKFIRQFKPGGEYRDNFGALKTLAVDESNKKIFVVNGTQALFSNLP